MARNLEPCHQSIGRHGPIDLLHQYDALTVLMYIDICRARAAAMFSMYMIFSAHTR